MGESVTGRRRETREHGGQLVERALTGDEHVELGVREQSITSYMRRP